MTGLRRLIPLLDRVLVERIVAPTKSAGGVLLPETAVPKVRVRPLWKGRRRRRPLARSLSLCLRLRTLAAY
jgi:hypothetical protein